LTLNLTPEFDSHRNSTVFVMKGIRNQSASIRPTIWQICDGVAGNPRL